MSIYPPFLTTIVQPPAEPVTLDEVKLYLRIDGADEDNLLSSFIKAARINAESYLRRSLITQTLRMKFPYAICEREALWRAPVQQISSVTAYDIDDNSTLIDPSRYRLEDGRDIYSVTEIFAHKLEVEYIAGYGDNPPDVPEPLRQGLLAHIANIYERREMAVIPQTAVSLYNPYRVYL